MAQTFSRQQIQEMAARWMPDDWNRRDWRIHTDTSDFFQVKYGDALLLDGRPYLIRNCAREGRFGLDEEVKHWVRRSIDLPTGQMCIIKMVFYEKFTASIGGIEFECFRSPRKEARILNLVHGHPNFMHGISAADTGDNTVRVIEHISGKSLANHIADLRQPHEAYFYETLPGILKNFSECLAAIQFLHDNGEKHGDIRRDHILIDGQTGRYRWIDFDYNYRHRENIYGYDLFGLGNILIHIVGKGDLLVGDLRRKNPDLLSRIDEADLNIVFRNRLANLKKAYPYVPDSMNRVLLHFSRSANWFYERVEQLISDLKQAVDDIR